MTLNHNGSVDFTVTHVGFQAPVATLAQVKPVRAALSTSSVVNLISLDGRIVKRGIMAQGMARSSARYGAGVYLVQSTGTARMVAKTMVDKTSR